MSERRAAVLVLTLAALIALLGARPYAGGWNDGSRLATAEALVDRGSFVVDHSLFVQPEAFASAAAPHPYGPEKGGGTKDLLFIRGHFYSDKPPVLSLLLAGEYWLAQRLTGLTAPSHPDHFCYLLTVGSSGVAFVLVVWGLFLLGGTLGLSLATRLLLTASLALATVALPYSRQLNSHLPLLAVAMALTLLLHRLGAEEVGERERRWQLAGAGCLAGLGYTLDLGVGPVMLLCTGGLVLWRDRSRRSLLWFGLGAFPWLALHHSVNFALAGTFGPAARVAEYFQWPGCPFDPRVDPHALTGGWNHPSPGEFLRYAAALLVAKQGFFWHNLPLWLALPGFVRLVRQRIRNLPELVTGAAWAVGSWLLYAAGSSNYGGQACSIRWLVPALAPGFYCLALFLRSHPEGWRPLLLLSSVGGVMGAVMWSRGPWWPGVIPGYWLFSLTAAVGWAILVRRERALKRRAFVPITSVG